MRKIFLTGIFLFAAAVWGWAAPTGYEIMRMVDEQPSGDSGKQITSMQLINSRGSVRERKLISYFKDYGDVKKTVIVFQKPRDVEGVGYLSFSYDEPGVDDDTWLFLPALRKSRRISGSSRNDNFMGTDFTYDDMGERNIEEDTHKFLREEQLNGKKCWVVESVPKEPDMYSKRISWIQQDVLMLVKVEYYDRQDKLMKVLKASDISKVDGIWTAGVMEMEDLHKKHKTVIKFDETEYNISVNDNFFTVANLERGRIR